MKKYPIKYKGKEYEVRWMSHIFGTQLYIYQVDTYKILFKTIQTYTYKYDIAEDFIVEKLVTNGICKDDPNYYIEEIKVLFEKWEKYKHITKEYKTIQNNKEKALAEWDGVIE